MERPESESGKWGWVALAGFVLAWDLFARDTLSDAAGRAFATKTGRWIVPAVMVATVAHLLDFIPNALDPYHYLWVASNQLRKLLRLTS